MGTNPNKLFYYLYIIGFDAPNNTRRHFYYIYLLGCICSLYSNIYTNTAHKCEGHFYLFYLLGCICIRL